MDRRRQENILIAIALILIAVSFIFMFSKRYHSRLNGNDSLDVTKIHDATTVSSLINRGSTVSQDFVCPYDRISELVIIFNKTDENNDGTITVELLKGEETIFTQALSVKDIADQHRTKIKVDSTGNKGQAMTLKIAAGDDTGLALMIDEATEAWYSFDHQARKGTICFALNGH
ncbi:MAG: hypothetical protein IKS69_05785 [Erysipelotrichaceae bacterium]|nr:hypothetical protein [Erysipelotrichaceae bacterium]